VASTDAVTGRFLAAPVVDRIIKLVDFTGDCWLWQGDQVRGGYGRVSTGQVNGRSKRGPVHRVLWEALVGPIPDGLELDHLCRDARCVNPDHLEPVTHQENVLRSDNAAAINARKTHCVNGHALEGHNIYVPPKRPDRRYCRTCQNQRGREVARSHKEALS
jgi:hypothetical protein